MPRAERRAKNTTVALIGYGYWGPKLARVLSCLPACSGVVVWDICPARRAAAAAAGLRVAAGLGPLLADQAVTALAVATPPATHYDIAMRALSAGKHVFVEKPFTLSSAHGRALACRARALRRVLMTGHIFLYSPAVRRVSELVAGGAIGRLRRLEFHRAGPRPSMFTGPGAGVLWDLAPHDISIALRLAGRMPVSVSARTRRGAGGGAEWGRMLLSFPGGLKAGITVSSVSPEKIRLARFAGTGGTIIYDDTSRTGQVTLHAARSGRAQPVAGGEPLALECSEFLESIRLGKVPLSSGDFGVRVVNIIEAASASAACGGAAIGLL
jgi:predicted dehydrogenase